MTETTSITSTENFGSEKLNIMVDRLKNTSDPRRRYEYVLWLAKKLPVMSKDLMKDNIKVKGCVSQVYVLGEHDKSTGTIHWQGYSDALITKGLLALLIQGLDNLTPKEIIDINPNFITATGLHTSLTASRANGFMNILLCMKAQAHRFINNEALSI